jgi:hypothetical protein
MSRFDPKRPALLYLLAGIPAVIRPVYADEKLFALPIVGTLLVLSSLACALVKFAWLLLPGRTSVAGRAALAPQPGELAGWCMWRRIATAAAFGCFICVDAGAQTDDARVLYERGATLGRARGEVLQRCDRTRSFRRPVPLPTG